MAQSKNSALTIVLIIIIVLLAIFGAYYFVDSRQKAEDLSEVEVLMDIEKERVEDEYLDLTYQFDGYTSTIRNDSLLAQLEQEKNRVQELLEELRNTRSTNARRIQELRDELASVRKIMTHLVSQIDSLNTENKLLKSENTQIRQKYEASTQTVEELAKEKENLSEIVTRASKLEVVSCELTTLNDRNRRTGLFSRIATLQFDFTVAKNITAEPGHKVMYVRLSKPDGELVIKNPSQEFHFENMMIGYTMKKEFEYTGEAFEDVIYWKIDEPLMQGNYLVEFFADGYLIGSFDFSIKR